MNYNLAPIPSLTNLTYSLYKYVANHPLIINPPVIHPITEEQIHIQRYRLYPGLAPGAGLTCSIYPYAGSGDQPNPRTSSVSGLFEPHDISEHGTDHAVYHLIIEFYYNEVTLGNVSIDPDLIIVPEEAVTHPDQILLTSNETKAVDLEINPAIDIIGNYLALARYVVSDWFHKQIFPLKVKSFEVLYENISTSSNWEDNENVYFHKGLVMTRLDAYVSRGWRDKFINPLEKINITMKSFNTEK